MCLHTQFCHPYSSRLSFCATNKASIVHKNSIIESTRLLQLGFSYALPIFP